MATQARGLRSNNPGNIDRSTTTKWQGMADDQSSDPRFVVFKAPEWGIRALMRTLLTYQNQHGLYTTRAIINRWAPPSENNTGAYVNAVASACGVNPDDTIDLDMAAVALPFVKAIIVHENGSCPYSDAVILEGLRRAGVADAPPKPLVKSTPFVAQVGTAVAAAGAGTVQIASTASSYAPTIKSWADKLSDYTGSSVIQTVVTILLTVAGGLALLGIVTAVMKQRAKA